MLVTTLHEDGLWALDLVEPGDATFIETPGNTADVCAIGDALYLSLAEADSLLKLDRSTLQELEIAPVVAAASDSTGGPLPNSNPGALLCDAEQPNLRRPRCDNMIALNAHDLEIETDSDRGIPNDARQFG